MAKMPKINPPSNPPETPTNSRGILSPTIVYEDRNFLAINKPAGLITHPKNAGDKTPSVTSWILKHYPALADVGEYPDRPGIMHRLDKDTSGILLIAKNQPTYDYLKGLFQTRKIKKYYLALVIGQLKEDRGVIDAPIGRIGMKRTTIAKHGKLVDKKEASTEYTTVKKFEKYTLLEILPHTGRTHQIRVHLKHIGHPIIGDDLYAPKDAKRPEGLARLFLHARKLEFTTPDGKAMSLEADLPEGLQKVLSALE